MAGNICGGFVQMVRDGITKRLVIIAPSSAPHEGNCVLRLCCDIVGGSGDVFKSQPAVTSAGDLPLCPENRV